MPTSKQQQTMPITAKIKTAISSAPSDHALDRQIAAQLFDRHLVRSPLSCTCRREHILEPCAYTTDLVAMFQVVEKMQQAGYAVDMWGSREGSWRVRFVKESHWTDRPTSRSLGRAICLAAMLASSAKEVSELTWTPFGTASPPGIATQRPIRSPWR